MLSPGRLVLLVAVTAAACSSARPAADDREFREPDIEVGTVPTLSDTRATIQEDRTQKPSVETLILGDGTTVSRVTATDGSVFALRLPESFGVDLDLVDEPAAEDLAEVRGPDFSARVQVGHCPYEPLSQNGLGLLVAPIRLSQPPPSLAFCRPDEFLRLVIEPVPNVEFDIDQFHLIPLATGDRYTEWLYGQGLIHGQCCFEDRGPSWYRDTMIVSNGYLDGQIAAMDGATLRPLWVTDLVVELQSDQEWVGDGSYLFAVTDDGLVITTTGYGFLVGLSAETGSIIWQADLGGESSISITRTEDKRLYVASDVASEGDQSAPSLRLVDENTGEVMWVARGEPSTDLQWTSPVVMQGLVLFVDVPSYQPESAPDVTSHLLAFDAATGERRWTASLDSNTEAFSTADSILTDALTGLLLARNIEGVIFRFDPSTGRELWRSSIGLGEMVGLSSESVTVMVGGNEVEIDLETGEVHGQ